ncbi:hypothetical protein ACS0PU_012877 [Formica fusca]
MDISTNKTKTKLWRYVTDNNSYAISVGVNDQKPVAADSNEVYSTLS